MTLYAAYLDHCQSANYKPSTLKSMGVTAGRLKWFVAVSGPLSVRGYTNEVHARFLNYLTVTLKLHPNSTANTNKHLRAFFNWCKSGDIALHPQHASIKTEWASSERIYLTEAELKNIEQVKLSTALARVRDAFLFQCLTGLRYTELSRLDSSHIEQREGYRVLTFIAEKSVSVRAHKAKRVEVPILPGAEAILTRYADNFRLLPVLSNQKMNDYVKDIAKQAGVTSVVEQIVFEKGVPVLARVPKHELVSSHIGRHTFATLCLVKGVPLEVVSKALGHSDLKTTMIYAKIADDYKNRSIYNAWSTTTPSKKKAT
ncbi:site-specific integrase [Fibrella forsythiae]|uniref:Integrase catalytic domain-containing protein n=1 Tax=Fibrella forsythiae TaxID=2817061 RepID=A0ABS3JQ39_9BACT|nr:site-specific integrase [Fibrella forsythiae]MBO0951047.1 integrase catalytic domain-containing protein [Fibrella forsythiae]